MLIGSIVSLPQRTYLLIIHQRPVRNLGLAGKMPLIFEPACLTAIPFEDKPNGRYTWRSVTVAFARCAKPSAAARLAALTI